MDSKEKKNGKHWITNMRSVELAYDVQTIGDPFGYQTVHGKLVNGYRFSIHQWLA